MQESGPSFQGMTTRKPSRVRRIPLELPGDDAESDPDISDLEDDDENENSVKQTLTSEKEMLLRSLIAERKLEISATRFLEVQNEFLPRHREAVVAWLLQLNYVLQYPSDTFFSAIICLDTLCMQKPIQKSQIQLYAIACYIIAAKFDTHITPTIDRIKQVSGEKLERDTILAAEVEVLNIISFRLCHPNLKLFQRLYHGTGEVDMEIYELSIFLAELAIKKFDFIDYSPSVTALSAFILAHSSAEIEVVSDIVEVTIRWNTPEKIIACVEKLAEHFVTTASEISRPEVSDRIKKLDLRGCGDHIVMCHVNRE